MVAHAPDGGGTGDEIVLVVVSLPTIKVGVKAQLCGVAPGKEVLAENVRDEDLLIAPVKLIQVRVGVLFEHVESDQIVLPEIVVVVPEDAGAKIRVIKNEPSEIADERLNAEPGGNEIVIVRQVADVNFSKGFLERIPILLTCGIARVRQVGW